MSRAAETTPARFLGIADGTGFMGAPPSGETRRGFEAAFRIALLDPDAAGEDYRYGHALALQVCFAQGALAYRDQADAAQCPYTATTRAASAWRRGFNAMAYQALDIED